MDSLLEHPAINDAINTEETLYLIVNNKPPTIYTDKKITIIQQEELLTHPELLTILTHNTQQHKARLKEHTLYEYNNKTATNTQKQSLTHTINGTGGRTSIITTNGGKNLGKGVFTIPPNKEPIIEETLNKHKATYNKTTIYTKT